MKSRTAEAGFTLVETLASLTILALLSVMLAAGIQYARLRLSRGQGDAATAGVEAAQSLLRGRIERVFPYAPNNTGFATIDFTGEADHLAFDGPPPDAAAPDALQHYGLGLTPGGVLQLSMVSDLANDPTAAARPVPLLTGVASLDVAYFGVLAPDNQPQWRPRWRQQAALPRLVRIRVGFPPGDRRVWPDLVVAPAATLDSLCQIEFNTGRCRGRS